MLVLTKLKWDMSAVVATDFLDHLLGRLKLIISDNAWKLETNRRQADILATLRRQASNYVALCTIGKLMLILFFKILDHVR